MEEESYESVLMMALMYYRIITWFSVVHSGEYFDVTYMLLK